MKSVMIVYNQILQEEITAILDDLGLRGYTRFDDVRGRGTTDGDPHMGTHTWPVLNGAMVVVVEDESVEPLLQRLDDLDKAAPGRGIRAFVWAVEAVL